MLFEIYIRITTCSGTPRQHKPRCPNHPGSMSRTGYPVKQTQTQSISTRMQFVVPPGVAPMTKRYLHTTQPNGHHHHYQQLTLNLNLHTLFTFHLSFMCNFIPSIRIPLLSSLTLHLYICDPQGRYQGTRGHISCLGHYKLPLLLPSPLPEQLHALILCRVADNSDSPGTTSF